MVARLEFKGSSDMFKTIQSPQLIDCLGCHRENLFYVLKGFVFLLINHHTNMGDGIAVAQW